MARDTMYRARGRAVESSWFGPLIGAGVGALVAKALQSRAQDRRERERGWGYDRRFEGYPAYPDGRYPYADAAGGRYGDDARSLDAYEGAGAGGEATGGIGSKLGQKASEAKERAQEATGQLKGRIHETTSSLRERLPDRERIRESTHEDVGLWALGAMALGAMFGLALPETERERQLLEPARRKARELGQQARDVAVEKGTRAMDEAAEKLASPGEPGTSPTPGPQPPAVH